MVFLNQGVSNVGGKTKAQIKHGNLHDSPNGEAKNVRRIAAKWTIVYQDFRKAQLEDETTGRLVRAKENGEARPEWETLPHLPASTKMYWLQWDQLEIHEGVICKRYESRWWEISEMANSFAREILNPQAPSSPAPLIELDSTGIVLDDSDNVSEMPAPPPPPPQLTGQQLSRNKRMAPTSHSCHQTWRTSSKMQRKNLGGKWFVMQLLASYYSMLMDMETSACRNSQWVSRTLGVKKRLAEVKARFYWPGLTADVRSHLPKCYLLERSVADSWILGNGKSSNIWKRYSLNGNGLKIQNSNVAVYDTNPFLPNSKRRVTIKDIPLSAHESLIKEELVKLKCNVCDLLSVNFRGLRNKAKNVLSFLNGVNIKWLI